MVKATRSVTGKPLRGGVCNDMEPLFRRRWREESASSGSKPLSSTVDVLTVTEPSDPIYQDCFTGEPPDTQAFLTAQVLEMKRFQKVQVYEKVPIAQAKQGGHQVVGVRWVTVKNTDGTHRSRLVAEEIKTYSAPEVLAATPHEPHRVLLHRGKSRHVCEASDRG